MARTLAAFSLATMFILPAAATTSAADPLILKVGTTENLDSLNPFQTSLLVGYEVFTLNYDMLVGFGPNNEPVEGYASSWTQSTDGLTWTFKVHDGMTWSDGQPATAEDAAWTIKYVADAAKAGTSLGSGYRDPYVTNAAITSANATDATTLVVTTSRPNDRILQMYLPILPKHVWQNVAPDKIGDVPNYPPVVGTGPYQVVEWKTGQLVRLVRNDKYWGPKGAATEIVIQFFPDAANSMVEAFKSGELDYVRNPTAAQFEQLKTLPKTVAINAAGNSFTQINFNCYVKDVPNGGASTKALRDPAFRAALGYAIDRKTLITRVLGGYAVDGTTQIPAWQKDWHVEPTDIREFNVDKAKAALDAAGYPLKDGRRMDKEGKPINLRLLFPDNDPSYPKLAQFIVEWFGQLGIKVGPPKSADSSSLTTMEYLDTSIPLEGQLDYDMVIWGWIGDPDPNSLMQILTTNAISDASDSQWSNKRYDELYVLQNEAKTKEERKGYMTEIQQLFYDQAPYQILYYEDELHAYHTDKFGNWQTQPSPGGTPFFVNGSINYTTLTAAPAASPSASAGPSAAPVSSAAATPAPSGGGTGSPASDSTPLILAAVVIVVVVVVVAVLLVRRRADAVEDE
jgi:peptide/nickel transport system substrate-binding protein